MREFVELFKKEGDFTVKKIVENIFKAGITYDGINRRGVNISGKSEGANASGKTVKSLQVEASETELIISGRDGFSTLETGISPSQSQATPDIIYTWSKKKEIPFTNDKRRFFVAKRIAEKQQLVGSLLFRMKGRNDVYSNEVEPLVERLQEAIEKRFYEINIIK